MVLFLDVLFQIKLIYTLINLNMEQNTVFLFGDQYAAEMTKSALSRYFNSINFPGLVIIDIHYPHPSGDYKQNLYGLKLAREHVLDTQNIVLLRSWLDKGDLIEAPELQELLALPNVGFVRSDDLTSVKRQYLELSQVAAANPYPPLRIELAKRWQAEKEGKSCPREKLFVGEFLSGLFIDSDSLFDFAGNFNEPVKEALTATASSFRKQVFVLLDNPLGLGQEERFQEEREKIQNKLRNRLEKAFLSSWRLLYTPELQGATLEFVFSSQRPNDLKVMYDITTSHYTEIKDSYPG